MKPPEIFPMETPTDFQSSPLAVFSGNMIHIVYPDGKVTLIAEEELTKKQISKNLENCLFWGRFEEF